MSRFHLLTACSILVMSVGLEEARAEDSSRDHVVEAGQTLWEIALAHGCDVSDIQQVNHIDGKIIQPGQTLAIPRCDDQGKTRSRSAKPSRGDRGLFVLSHPVSAGDTLYEIARRYDTSVDDLRRRNRIEGNMIRPGQTLRVAVGKDGQGRPIPGQSVGSAAAGKLVNGMQLPRGRGYYLRRPHRAWGANHTIHHVRRAVAVVRSAFPRIHELAIGDISSRHGGPLAEHKSHQSGRDVDMGLYYKKPPSGYPQSFIRATKHNLDLEATWLLIESLASTARSPSGVEVMFLDYDLQKLLYEWARKRGVSKRVLGRLFQYPRGQWSTSGVVRHEPGHDTHVHVRFKCPKNDDSCW